MNGDDLAGTVMSMTSQGQTPARAMRTTIAADFMAELRRGEVASAQPFTVGHGKGVPPRRRRKSKQLCRDQNGFLAICLA